MYTDRERIAQGLYLLAAGADPVTFLATVRAYVLQHITTAKQAAELLRDLAKVNPPAFTEAMKSMQPPEPPPQSFKDFKKDLRAATAGLLQIAKSRRGATDEAEPVAPRARNSGRKAVRQSTRARRGS
jgi:hypothetical protein